MLAHGLFLILSVISVRESAASSFSKSARGTSTAQFLRLPVDARASALGEAYSTLADQASAIYWNPAALTQIPGKSLTLMHAAYLESIFYDFAAYGQKLGDSLAFGIGVQYLSAGSLTETDIAGSETGSFSPYDMAVSFAGGYDFDSNGPALGISGKYIQSKVATSASTFAGDAGLLSPLFLDERLRASLVAANLGGTLKFDKESESLPLVIRAGMAYHFAKGVLALEEGFPNDDRPYSSLGYEHRFFTDKILSLNARLGINSRTLGEVGGLTGTSMGLGILFSQFAFDYAFIPFGHLGTTHRLSVTWSGPPYPRIHSYNMRIQDDDLQNDHESIPVRRPKRSEKQKGPGWLY